jgi:hypothetical protein
MSSRRDEIAIKPLGREKYSVPDPNSEGWILTPAEVYEAFDETPEIQWEPLFRDSSQVLDPNIIGYPCYHATYEDRQSVRKITVNVKIRPDRLARIDKIRSGLRSKILAHSPRARALSKAGKCTVVVLPTDGFSSDVMTYRV